jgi:hypothetical protein
MFDAAQKHKFCDATWSIKHSSERPTSKKPLPELPTKIKNEDTAINEKNIWMPEVCYNGE